MLLKHARADPNATDKRGRTLLMTICRNQHVCVEAARLQLEAGADPALAQQPNVFIPLHFAALNGHIDLVHMLHSGAPATLNRCDSKGKMPLFFACAEDHEGVVSQLKSACVRSR